VNFVDRGEKVRLTNPVLRKTLNNRENLNRAYFMYCYKVNERFKIKLLLREFLMTFSGLKAKSKERRFQFELKLKKK
jgi:hypothetical protein